MWNNCFKISDHDKLLDYNNRCSIVGNQRNIGLPNDTLITQNMTCYRNFKKGNRLFL